MTGGSTCRASRREPSGLLSVTRLLVHDLAQAVTPARGVAPLRGSDLRAVHVTEDAYVLCDGARIEAVGPMRELPALTGEVETVDGRGAKGRVDLLLEGGADAPLDVGA